MLSSASYDGLVATVSNGRGHATATTVDAAGRVVKVLDANGGVTTYSYGPFDQLRTVQDPVGQSTPGHSRTIQKDDYGFATVVTSPDRGTENFAYSAFGNVTTATASGTTKVYSYDALGRQTQLIDEDGTTQWKWDTAAHGVGRLAQVVGPDQFTSTFYKYDAFGRLEATTTQDAFGSNTVAFGYDDVSGHSRVQEVAYPNNASVAVSVAYDYDARGNLIKITDGSNGAVIWNWTSGDGSNRVSQDAFANGIIQRTRVYDDLHDGALATVRTSVNGKTLQNLTYSYDNENNLTSRADGGGWTFQGTTATPQVEAFCYDSLDRLTDVDLGTPCGGTVAHYTYDADGNLKSKSDLGSYSYDAVHVHAVTTAGTSTYSYDGRGNQITRPRSSSAGTNLAGTPAVHYSSLDLPRTYSSGSIVSWSGDATPVNPNPVCAGESAATGAGASGPMACIIGTDSVSLADGVTAHVDVATRGLDVGVGSVLDGNAVVAGDTFMRDSSTIVGGLTTSGKVTSQSSFKIGTTFAVTTASVPLIPTQAFATGTGFFEIPNDKVSALAPGNFGDATIRARSITRFSAGAYNFASLNVEPGATLVFDASGGPINFNVQGSVTLQGVLFQPATKVLQLALYSNGCSVTLVGPMSFPGTITAPHAAVTTQNSAAVQGCVWARSVQVGPHTDSAIGGSGVACTVDSVGTKKQVSCGDGSVSFAYDGNGKRISKATPTQRIHYVSDLYEQVIDTHSGHVTHKFYVYSPTGAVAVLNKVRDSKGLVVGTDSTQYLFTDHQGSLDVTADSTGTAIDRRSYDPFGQVKTQRAGLTSTTGLTDPQIFGFAGHEDDADLGIVNMRGRVYDPVLGRFMTADPMVGRPFRPQAWNSYSYVYNNPLSRVDPSGFEPYGYQIFEETPDPGDDYAIVVRAPRLDALPLTSIDLGWGGLATTDATPMKQAFTTAFDKTVQDTANGFVKFSVKGAILTISWEVSAAAVMFVTASGILDPGAANAPTFDSPRIPQQSATHRALEIGVPVVLGGIPFLGPKPPPGFGPEDKEIESLLLGPSGPEGRGLPSAASWGNSATLARHFGDHGPDFGSNSADEYAEEASAFLQRAQAESLPTKIDANGVIRVYEPKTNTFGAFNPNGTTRTFFTPARGAAYWADQPGGEPWTPGGGQ
ncbi:MAG TPA: RHS repeat-associated core domain-containing protein [Polyangiaceae bacterium]